MPSAQRRDARTQDPKGNGRPQWGRRCQEHSDGTQEPKTHWATKDPTGIKDAKAQSAKGRQNPRS
eukprot:6459328-Amphidinium_carterae.2